jgi:hypothetical protein
MNDSIEDRVYALVAEERGTRREKLAPIPSPSNNLGMEGDDAVEFFEEFGKEFGVDLQRLHEDGHCYCSPEGVILSAGLFLAIPGSIIAVALIKLFPQLPDWLCLCSASWFGLQLSQLGATGETENCLHRSRFKIWLISQKQVDGSRMCLRKSKPKQQRDLPNMVGYGGPPHWFSP